MFGCRDIVKVDPDPLTSIDPDPALTSRLLGNEGALLYRLGRSAEAEPILQTLLAERTESLGPDHPDTAEVENRLAITLMDLGRLDEAEPLARGVLERVVRIEGESSPEAFLATNHLASLLNDQRKFAEARDLIDSILPEAIEISGKDHPITLMLQGTLSQSCWSSGDQDRAVDLALTTLHLRRARFGDAHPDTLTAVNFVVSMLHRVHRDVEAAAIAREALDHLDVSQLPADHRSVVYVRFALAEVLLATDQLDEAEIELLQVHASYLSSYGPGHARTRRVATMLVDLYERKGNAEGVRRFSPIE